MNELIENIFTDIKTRAKEISKINDQNALDVMHIPSSQNEELVRLLLRNKKLINLLADGIADISSTAIWINRINKEEATWKYDKY